MTNHKLPFGKLTIGKNALRIPQYFSKVFKGKENNIERAFRDTKDEKELQIKLKIFEILFRLNKRKKEPFGMLVIYNFKEEWFDKFCSFPDISQNIFKDKKLNILKTPLNEVINAFSLTSDFDGAILINNKGTVIASGVFLENIKAKEVALTLNPSKAEDLSAAFGFKKKVHTRHLTAIASSYVLKHTTVFVISEEDRSLRIFEKGRIIYSTIKGEANYEAQS
ncbi:MAG TPA: diadenylate cyclase [Candidatus Paceibacterota bacterium]|jgi:DNA integrity scanning protein DisA with diadenylate cyclase activity|nr:diadenylate cyclase [Candidatus Paceibacterota bacterium]HRS47888.1 diadenylate cyclase [Candidatus Paceibacterota bacterium]